MTTPTGNGQTRKTLASQLDRLDGILDALSDGLNQAVASAVEGAVHQAVEAAVRQAVGQAVQEAVQAVLAEVLTNPDLQAALRVATAPPPPAPANTVKGALAWAWNGCRRALTKAAGFVARTTSTGWRLARRHPAGALAVGGAAVVMGMAAWWATPFLAAAAGWVGGFATARLAQVRDGLRRLLTAVE
jgi:hypothetical protein